MVVEGGTGAALGGELVSGAAGVVAPSGGTVCGETGLEMVFVSAGAPDGIGVEEGVAAAIGAEEVRTAPSTWNFSRSARKRSSIWLWETEKYTMRAMMKSKAAVARTMERLRSIKGLYPTHGTTDFNYFQPRRALPCWPRSPRTKGIVSA